MPRLGYGGGQAPSIFDLLPPAAAAQLGFGQAKPGEKEPPRVVPGVASWPPLGDDWTPPPHGPGDPTPAPFGGVIRQPGEGPPYSPYWGDGTPDPGGLNILPRKMVPKAPRPGDPDATPPGGGPPPQVRPAEPTPRPPSVQPRGGAPKTGAQPPEWVPPAPPTQKVPPPGQPLPPDVLPDSGPPSDVGSSGVDLGGLGDGSWNFGDGSSIDLAGPEPLGSYQGSGFISDGPQYGTVPGVIRGDRVYGHIYRGRPAIPPAGPGPKADPALGQFGDPSSALHDLPPQPPLPPSVIPPRTTSPFVPTTPPGAVAGDWAPSAWGGLAYWTALDYTLGFLYDNYLAGPGPVQVKPVPLTGDFSGYVPPAVVKPLRPLTSNLFTFARPATPGYLSSGGNFSPSVQPPLPPPPKGPPRGRAARGGVSWSGRHPDPDPDGQGAGAHSPSNPPGSP